MHCGNSGATERKGINKRHGKVSSVPLWGPKRARKGTYTTFVFRLCLWLRKGVVCQFQLPFLTLLGNGAKVELHKQNCDFSSAGQPCLVTICRNSVVLTSTRTQAPSQGVFIHMGLFFFLLVITSQFSH